MKKCIICRKNEEMTKKFITVRAKGCRNKSICFRCAAGLTSFTNHVLRLEEVKDSEEGDSFFRTSKKWCCPLTSRKKSQ